MKRVKESSPDKESHVVNCCCYCCSFLVEAIDRARFVLSKTRWVGGVWYKGLDCRSSLVDKQNRGRCAAMRRGLQRGSGGVASFRKGSQKERGDPCVCRPKS